VTPWPAQSVASGRGNRPFGWQKDKSTLEPREAEIIKLVTKTCSTAIAPNGICRTMD